MSPRAPKRMRELIGGVAVVVTAAVSMGVTAIPSTARFTDSDTSIGTLSSDTLKPVAGLTVTSNTFNQYDLAWTPSLTTYVTGYKVQRSTSAAGPWTTIGTIGSRTTNQFTDTTAGITRWFYRVDAIARNWIGPSASPQAPVAKGSAFYDGFEGPIPDQDLHGQPTEDGSEIWSVWAGSIVDAKSYGAWGAPDVTSIAVIETPTQNAQMYGRDFDGVEALIIRAKNATNYIWVGGNAVSGSFEIVEVRNGVRTVIQSTTVPLNIPVRLEARGDTITVYQDAADESTGGTLFMTARTSYLLGDPAAHWFGIGFADSWGGNTYMIHNSLP